MVQILLPTDIKMSFQVSRLETSYQHTSRGTHDIPTSAACEYAEWNVTWGYRRYIRKKK